MVLAPGSPYPRVVDQDELCVKLCTAATRDQELERWSGGADVAESWRSVLTALLP